MASARKTDADFDFARERRRLVNQIERQGIGDVAVLKAMQSVPREAFVAPELHEFAYENAPLPIGNEQTISQSFIVALMAAALDLSPDDCVLEIGAGSGYAAAVLSLIARKVFTVERRRELAESAQDRLQEEGFNNVRVLHGDGTLGWPEYAPYDAIVVTAGGPDVPQPLLEQLRVGGRLVLPIGQDRSMQKLIRIRKTGENDYEQEDLGDVRFVPLVGVAGWEGDDSEWNSGPFHPDQPDHGDCRAARGATAAMRRSPAAPAGTSLQAN